MEEIKMEGLDSVVTTEIDQVLNFPNASTL